MSILKALEKRKTEQPIGNDEDHAPKRRSTVVPFDKAERSDALPDLFSSEEFKIGTPGSAFIEQSDSLIGTALPELETNDPAGATLSAAGLTRPAARQLPEFARWTVEAERVEPRLVAITQPHSTYCEEYRSLRTHVLHKSQRQKLQSIVVASVNPSEGKSVTALNLSWMLAQTDGVKALIIDSDLRMPSLTDYLGIETDKGLSDILSGKGTLTDSIVKLEPSGLHLLPGGEARHDVAELISGPKFKEILREAREIFDYVIIDAPPLGIFTDATVLINHADGAILVVRAGRTKYTAVDRVLESLPKDRMMGVVLNQSDEVLSESNYGYGYYKKG
ncbi:MAG: CpsD/CapB family tyrosine-protein kinase, partial [Acidobacteria bacterium]|nr:CpsD/CapB family tyrosine-protein kinase [Acidobacteriota bacterium]